MSQTNQIKILLLAPSAGTNSLFRPESRTGFSKDRWAIPPLGLYRIAGYLMRDKEIVVEVFDSYVDTEDFLAQRVNEMKYDIIGFSITHQTLENDIYFMHLCKRLTPSSVLIVGGDEATFNYTNVMKIAPVDYTVLGEGEKPMKEMCDLLKEGSQDFSKITGLIRRNGKRLKKTGPNYAMSHAEFEEATFAMDFADVPYERYWDKIESFYTNPDLNETRTVRIFTTNFCPLNCTFCSSTNFLDAAGGSPNKRFGGNRKPEVGGDNRTLLAGLSPQSIMDVVLNAYQGHPTLKNIFINDDDFVLQKKKVRDFCDLIIESRQRGEIPQDLTLMCLSRIDDIEDKTLEKMSEASFRMIGFGVESFSQKILNDLNKGITVDQIHDTISKVLKYKITPYMNVILFPPSATTEDLLVTMKTCIDYIEKGLEVAIEPFLIPLMGAAITHEGYEIVYDEIPIPLTDKVLKLGTVILPSDETVRELHMNFKDHYHVCLKTLTEKYNIKHTPAKFRSLISFYATYDLMGQHDFELKRIEKIIVDKFCDAFSDRYDWSKAV